MYSDMDYNFQQIFKAYSSNIYKPLLTDIW